MLGLATAIAILAMLLAGPLSGLWSFYVTMRSIKHKLPELHQAEALKQEVGRLAPLQWDNPLAELVRCEKAIPAAEKALREFEEAVQNTREQNLPEDDGEELLERSKQLREKLGSCGPPCARSQKRWRAAPPRGQMNCLSFHASESRQRSRTWRGPPTTCAPKSATTSTSRSTSHDAITRSLSSS